MPLHVDLLKLARDLIDRNLDAHIGADLRRAASTASYALFHLLTYEATERLVTIVSLRPRVARSFQQKTMKTVCGEIGTLKSDQDGKSVANAGVIHPIRIQNIARTFVDL